MTEDTKETTAKETISRIAAWDTSMKVEIKGPDKATEYVEITKIPWEELEAIYFRFTDKIVPVIQGLMMAYRKAVKSGSQEMDLNLGEIVREIPEVVGAFMAASLGCDSKDIAKIDSDIYFYLFGKALAYNFVANERVEDFFSTVSGLFRSKTGTRTTSGAEG